MSLENLAENIHKQLNITQEIRNFREYSFGSLSKIPEQRRSEEELVGKTINSLKKQLHIINNSLPEILKNIKIEKKLPTKTKESKEEIKTLVKLEYSNAEKKEKEKVTVMKADREKYLKELNISKDLINKLKKRIHKKPSGGGVSFQKPSSYGKLSNYFFRKTSRKLILNGHFHKLNTKLRKSNSSFIINTYVSILLFTHLITLIISLITVAALITLGILPEGSRGILFGLGIISGGQLLVWLIIYASPSLEVSSIQNKINQELPFITLHMAAIAGSGIEPSRIFSIIAASGDYPHTRKELIKVINQTNYYGYDLVNALRNVAKTTSSEKLSELFRGLAVTIGSGGSLEEFLHKRSETMTTDYRLDREKYAKVAENFMNIYIALVIAAPLIFLLLLILIGISGTGLDYTITQLSVMMVSGVILINIVFLMILHLKQPKY